MYSRGQQPYKFIVTKESVWIEKKSSTSTGLVWDTKREVACEQALCLGKGWKNQKVREGKRWGPVDTHLGPLFCLLVLVIADHLSERSLSVTWIHWNVINFACKKEVSIIGNTQLLPCTKMLLFFQWVFSLMGRLCSGGFSFSWENVIFVAYFILRGCDLHIDFLRLLFLVGVICRLMQEHSLRLKECISQVPEDAMLKIGRPLYQRLFISNCMLPADQKNYVNQTCQ